MTDEIERLRRELSETRGRLAGARLRERDNEREVERLRDALRTGEEQEARLRAALTQIAQGDFHGLIGLVLDGKWQEVATRMQQIAKEALAPQVKP
jgi:chromosome segregation ATPase